MKYYWHTVMAVALLKMLVAAKRSLPVFSTDRDRTIIIPIEDIGTKVTLVGRLGEPLGKMMEVKGGIPHDSWTLS